MAGAGDTEVTGSGERRGRQFVAMLETIKFQHTVFALPFALTGMVLAARGWPSAWSVGWVIVAMVGSMLVSYVRARAEANGVSLTAGLFTRSERVVLLAAALVLDLLRPALWVLALLTMLTALQRLYLAGRRLHDVTDERGERT